MLLLLLVILIRIELVFVLAPALAWACLIFAPKFVVAADTVGAFGGALSDFHAPHPQASTVSAAWVTHVESPAIVRMINCI